MYQYQFIINILTDVLSNIAESDFSEETRLAYTEGAISALTKYLITCQEAQNATVNVIGGVFDGK